MHRDIIQKIAIYHSQLNNNKYKQQVQRWVHRFSRILFPTPDQKLNISEIEDYLNQLKKNLIQLLNSLSHKQEFNKSEAIAQHFINSIIQIKKILQIDLKAKFKNSNQFSFEEIKKIYPQFLHILHYRLAHWFYIKGQNQLATLITQVIQGQDQIYIAESCKIGSGFVLLGKKNIEIGETAVIGRNCKIYDGVVLGELSHQQKKGELQKHTKRHPTLQDNVTIYADAVILGGETVISEGCSVLPNSNILVKNQQSLNIQNMKDQFSLQGLIGNTPLVQIKNIFNHPHVKILAKLQGQNPGGSVKDRPAYNMIKQALKRGEIKPGMKLIQPTSGNTGIALAMIACIFNLDIELVMPQNSTAERIQTMQAYGAKVILTPAKDAIQGSRDYAEAQVAKGGYKMLNQFANPDNPMAHYKSTGPQIWRDTKGTVTHFISGMGTTGTIMGTGRFLREKNPDIKLIGVQPTPGSKIPGIRRWAPQYVPQIFDRSKINQVMDATEQESLTMMRRLAKQQGIFTGVSSGANIAAAVRLAKTLEKGVLVAIICDRGDRYLSAGIFTNKAKS